MPARKQFQVRMALGKSGSIQFPRVHGRKAWLLSVCIALGLLSSYSANSPAQSLPQDAAWAEFARLKPTSLLLYPPLARQAELSLLNPELSPELSQQADDLLIPASTVKLITAWLALTRWGPEHRFNTDFCYFPSRQTLWVKGSGDPYLVSDELRLAVSGIKAANFGPIRQLAIDGSLFRSNLRLPGTGDSANPYDAIPSAIAANFNTVHLRKENAAVRSGEAETPLTAFAASKANRISLKEPRVNTGPSVAEAEQHFAELFTALLSEQGIQTSDDILYGTLPSPKPFSTERQLSEPQCYTHQNSRRLADVLQPMLKYSTNFIANQLILMLAADANGKAANAAAVENYLQQQLQQAFGWQDFRLRDGAGLSRDNRLSARQLLDVVTALAPWRELLPEIAPGVFAKSGSLNGVSTLAGYLVHDEAWQPFAIMMNQRSSYRLRNRLAVSLRKHVNAKSGGQKRK